VTAPGRVLRSATGRPQDCVLKLLTREAPEVLEGLTREAPEALEGLTREAPEALEGLIAFLGGVGSLVSKRSA